MEMATSMKDWDKALVRLRRWLAGKSPRLRPTPTCISMAEAAARLGITQVELGKLMRRRRIPQTVLDRKRLVSVSRVEELSRLMRRH